MTGTHVSTDWGGGVWEVSKDTGLTNTLITTVGRKMGGDVSQCGLKYVQII